MPMIAPVAHAVTDLIASTGTHLPRRTRVRLVWILLGVLTAQSIVGRRIASTAEAITPDSPQAERHERRVRRVWNDPRLTWEHAYAPVIRRVLRWQRAKRLRILIDESGYTAVTRVLVAAVWYRGRAIPLAWVHWRAQGPLPCSSWELTDARLAQVASLLPPERSVVVIADRAFGHPTFTDRITAQGWDWVVRVQRQTRYRDTTGRGIPLGDVLPTAGRRWKGQGKLFKNATWREVSVVAVWSRRHTEPLLLASSLPLAWDLIAEYRLRSAIETLFRDWKRAGWQWEARQVTDRDHLGGQILVLALTTLIVIMQGDEAANAILARPGAARRTRTWAGKHSLFRLGRDRIQARLWGTVTTPIVWTLDAWDVPTWPAACRWHHALAGTNLRSHSRAA